MPVATNSPRVVDNRANVSKRPVKGEKPKSQPLQLIGQHEKQAWAESFKDPSVVGYSFYNLEDPFDYPFKDQDSVWVRTQGNNWMFGRVSGHTIRVGQTRHRKQGLFYPVNFGSKYNLRKYFAPTNGEIKPDTEGVRELLRDGGWLDLDDEFSMSDSGSAYTE